MKIQTLAVLALTGLLTACQSSPKGGSATSDKWTETLVCPEETFTNIGRNDCFILEPGYQLVLRGDEAGIKTEVTITVLEEAQDINGISTRVVEERETTEGKLVEVSRNFYAMGAVTHNACYFGEDVDIFKDGKISHEGAWREGIGGAKHGVMMPAMNKVGERYYQEKAPGVAQDRAENLSINAVTDTSLGTFEHCLLVRETTPIEPGSVESKLYVPGIGLVRDDHLKLASHGFMKK